MSLEQKCEQMCNSLRVASRKMATLSATQKNNALKAVAKGLDENRSSILEANQKDVDNARAKGMKESLVDRLILNDARINGMIESIDCIISQTDPIGEITSGWKTLSNLKIKQMRVPLGVVSIIYESRPNVTVDAFALAYKSGNAILLRGSSSAKNSNAKIVEVIKQSLKNSNDGIENSIELSLSDSHDDVDWILNAVGKIDCVLPRGGAKLIQTVVLNARVPVIETGSGVCHLFVDESADLDNAALIAENAKLQRPGVCNAIETCLVHKNCANAFLPKLYEKLNNRAELKCCEKSFAILEKYNSSKVLKATEEDFGFEFLDTILAVKVVDSVQDAIEHINAHNTKHSESILTNDYANAVKFQTEVDAACVYVNASTRFTDGGEFGFGAELGISTQKLHARGPMGLGALTTTKYLIDGEGQIR